MRNTDPLNNTLPPLPLRGERGPHVCEIVRLYLAIIDDLPDAQVREVMEHVRGCADCAEAQRSLQLVTRAIGSLPASVPSAHVDRAVLEAIAAHDGRHVLTTPARRRAQRVSGTMGAINRPLQRGWVGATFAVALVATLLLALVGTLYFSGDIAHAPATFELPANLTWNGYVVYHTETRLDSHGNRYRVIAYYNLATGDTNVETEMDNTLDVMAIGNDNKMLGLDMMHHVAQWNADAWDTDESMFNLALLRKNLQSKQDTFMDIDQFEGQRVYRIHCNNGLTLLLSMDYMPVNVLRGAVGPGTGQPVYDTVRLIPTSQVSNSMWDMTIPHGFTMGTLPAKP